MKYSIFYHPQSETGAAADFIPFYHNGMFHLFYLFDHRAPDSCGEGISWNKLTTADLLHFTDQEAVLAHGTICDPDLYVFTGSVLQANNLFHIFYTGHNPHIHTFGYQSECIMHAVSRDLCHWVKLPEDTFYAPDDYDKCDFRDPFVYPSSDNSQYYMLLCARPCKGNAVRKGETFRMVSHDLKHWKPDGICYAPQKFQSLECPDLFQIGDWWYLIFSENTEKSMTRYRMSRSSSGPWSKPVNDTLDGRAYYAAKTAANEKNRYLFGWIPTRQENHDKNPWMWGGNLLIHQLIQRQDGTLGVSMPESIRNAFIPCLSIQDTILSSPYSTKTAPLLTDVPDTWLLTANCRILSEQSDSFGILVRHNASEDSSYSFTIRCGERSLSVNTFPCFPQNAFDAYELRRPLPAADEYFLELLADHDIFVLYVNGECALSVRLCDLSGTGISFYVSHAEIAFSAVEFYTLQ